MNTCMAAGGCRARRVLNGRYCAISGFRCILCLSVERRLPQTTPPPSIPAWLLVAVARVASSMEHIMHCLYSKHILCIPRARGCANSACSSQPSMAVGGYRARRALNGLYYALSLFKHILCIPVARKLLHQFLH